MSAEKDVPDPPSASHVYMLDYLMRLQKNMPQQLLLSIGEINIIRLSSFIAGYRACQSINGIQDNGYTLFRSWLRDVKAEFPTDGWDKKYLHDCGGDHERAIHKFLGFVAEFVALRDRASQSHD
ncbi:hypothetical protein POL68_14275 [Stigmatella sp. ncwal1]|uniref:CRISPR type III-B/RAMP module-associated protein Cmr5 n=1 Tax=Stigmatella ashevillensis TaxID=2995309 RepID=A0ABT5D7J4_9BACT|nr:hypothetical protein [Stigmatella ashevillena]MDC0709634.1 hypothetical protein [Stigmatella ashevillena]